MSDAGCRGGGSCGRSRLVVSNHGGRQLDRAPTPLELLPGVTAAVGDRTEVFLDGGVRGGADRHGRRRPGRCD